VKDGAKRERQVREVLEAQGWWVARAAGSLGDADLIALKDGKRPRLIEVKANEGSPYKTFGRLHRAELREAARRTGAVAELVHWPSRSLPVWIPESEWPP
jgi:Holliday junction resolvase